MKLGRNASLYREVQAELERFAPLRSKIEFDFKEDPKGHFFSLIKLKSPGRIFFVKKEGETLLESFHKAVQAIKIQLAKNKTNRRFLKKPSYS
jgi:hypothetical protein